MPTIIGNNTVGGSSVSPNRQHIHNYAPYLTTPTENLSLNEAFVYVNGGDTGEVTIEVGVYRNSDYALIEKTTVIIPAGGDAGWYSAAFSAQNEIVSGVEYTVAFAAPSGGSVSLRSSDNGSVQGPFNAERFVLPDPFVDDGGVSRSYSVYATAQGASTTTLPGLPATTVTQADGSPLASTSVTRKVTRSGTEIFNGSVSTDAQGVLPELDLSETAAEVDDDLVDRFEFTGTAPYMSAIEYTVKAEDIGGE